MRRERPTTLKKKMSPINWGRKNKTIQRPHFSSINSAKKIKKFYNTLSASLWGNTHMLLISIQTLGRGVCKYLTKSYRHLLFYWAILLLKFYSIDALAIIWKDIFICLFTASLLGIEKTKNSPNVHHEGIKLWYIHRIKCHAAIKRNKNILKNELRNSFIYCYRAISKIY